MTFNPEFDGTLLSLQVGVTPVMAYTSQLRKVETCFTDAKQNTLILLRAGCDYKN